MPSTRRFIELLVDGRWPLLALAAILALVAWFPSRRVSFDRSIDNMFSPRDPVMAPYRHFQRIFGDHEVLLAVYEDPQLLRDDGRGLQRLATVSQRLRDVPGVRDVLSLAEIDELVAGVEKPLGFLAPKRESPALLDGDSPLARAYLELFEGYTHSSDGRIAALACMIDPAAVDAPDPQRKIVDDVRAVMADLPEGLAPGVVAGEPVMVVDGFRLVEQDGRRLGFWSTLLLSLTLAISFRSLRWLLAPLAVVQLSVVLTKALLNVLNLQLTLVSSMLTALVTVVGVATVTHLIVGYYDHRAAGKSPREALVTAAALLAWPIAGAIVTDAIGFGSLWWSSVGPVFDFGTMMVFGSLLVLPATMLIVPALALARPTSTPNSPATDLPQKERPSLLRRGLSRIVRAVAAHPAFVLMAALVVGVLSLIGSLRLAVETDFTKNFRAESEIVRSYNLIESRLGGAGVWDVLVPAPKVLDQDYLDRVLALEDRLRKIRLPGDPESPSPLRKEGQDEGPPALTKVISLADAIRAAQADPGLGLLPPEMRAQGMATVMPNFTKALRAVDPATDQPWLRIMLRSRERLPAEWKKEVLRGVHAAVEDAFPGNGNEPPGEVTGYHVLVTTLVDSLVRDQWAMFGLSCLGIALMMLVAFRSPAIAVLSLVPNVLPVLLVTGLMGWLGIRINMGAAMIAAVSMGLSVDSSIHYITAFRRAIREGCTVSEALERVQQSVGTAMFLSTIAILVGFAVLCLSDFIPTIYFGVLAALTMLGGLAGNLVVLPLLLLWVTPESTSPTRKRGISIAS